MVSPAYSDLSMSAAPEAPPPRSTKKTAHQSPCHYLYDGDIFLYI